MTFESARWCLIHNDFKQRYKLQWNQHMERRVTFSNVSLLNVTLQTKTREILVSNTCLNTR